MRVALFFDGKNFYSGYKDHAPGYTIDFVKLSQWLIARVNGTILTGAHYYTGVEPETDTRNKEKLGVFLDRLEIQPGYFVHRFPRKKRTISCKACLDVTTYTTEKEVDTTMVADMLRLAAVNAFDILILMSGDSDHAPAIEGVRMLGKMAYVSTWDGGGLSSRLRRAAFDHVNLKEGLSVFAALSVAPRYRVATLSAPTKSVDDGDQAFLVELRLAQDKFAPRFIGVHYFITKWESAILKPEPIIRRRILNRLIERGLVETFDAPNGDRAMRIREVSSKSSGG